MVVLWPAVVRLGRLVMEVDRVVRQDQRSETALHRYTPQLTCLQLVET
jgi:hypothetical protein